MDRVAEFTNLAERLRANGLDLDSVLRQLRADGATIIDCVKVIRSVERVALGRAKEIVDASTTWADRFEANDALREHAIVTLEDEIDP